MHPPSARLTINASVDQLLLAAGVWWALSANRLFLAGALAERSLLDGPGIGLAAALLAMLVALHYLLLAPFATRHTVKPLLALLLAGTAFATHYMQAFGVYLDPSMLRNVLRTDAAEARELLSWNLALHLLLYAALPLVLLARVRVVRRPWRRAGVVRVVGMVAAAVVLVGALLSVFKPLAALMRNHKELRYLATPANYLWSGGVVVADQLRGAAKPREAIGLDAAPGPLLAARTRPLLLVLVVGETARAANWGLNGHARQTTPELAQLQAGAAAASETFISYSDVTSCGTNTEVSLPCMFAPVGRRDYDEGRIRGSESLLHVLTRGGVAVHWRDNQSGCKGVCAGLPQDAVASTDSALCSQGRCLDEGLLAGLPARLAALQGTRATQLLVLHMLGNHGPAYFRRYPPAFARFTPACEHDDLQRCSRDAIVNAYDNALLYTDHVLARLITLLRGSAGSVDAAVLYVSDHGESLGENNLYLHGLPYAIAPDVQKRVPMLLWLSAAAPAALALDAACLQRGAALPLSHDHLFHTLLALAGVHTALYAPQWDLAAGCRAPQSAPTAKDQK